MCLFHIDRLLRKKSVTVFISIKTIYESALFFKRLSFKNEDKGALAGENLSNLIQRAPQPHLKS